MSTDYAERLSPLLKALEARGAVATRHNGQTHYVLGSVTFTVPNGKQVSSRSFHDAKQRLAEIMRRHDRVARRFAPAKGHGMKPSEVDGWLPLGPPASGPPPPPPEPLEPAAPPPPPPAPEDVPEDVPHEAPEATPTARVYPCRMCPRTFTWSPARARHEQKHEAEAKGERLTRAKNGEGKGSAPAPVLEPAAPVVKLATVRRQRGGPRPMFAPAALDGPAPALATVPEIIDYLLGRITGEPEGREVAARLELIRGGYLKLETEVRYHRAQIRLMGDTLENVGSMVRAALPSTIDRIRGTKPGGPLA